MKEETGLTILDPRSVGVKQFPLENGRYVVMLCAKSSFVDKVIEEVAAYISDVALTVKGFTRRGLYRMKQFYETYKDDEFVSALLTQISWTNHLMIVLQNKL